MSGATEPRPEAMFSCLCFLTDESIFKEQPEFESESYGIRLSRGLTEPFLLQDLTARGRGPLANPVELVPQDFDLVYIPVPEPSTILMLLIGTLSVLQHPVSFSLP